MNANKESLQVKRARARIAYLKSLGYVEATPQMQKARIRLMNALTNQS